MSEEQATFTPIIKHLKGRIAVSLPQLNKLVEQLWDESIGFGGNVYTGTEDWTDDGLMMLSLDALKEALSSWAMDWRGYPRKTEVFYLFISFPSPHTLEVADRTVNDFMNRTFVPNALFGLRDIVYSLKTQNSDIGVHMLINRWNGEDLLAFNYNTDRNYESLRRLLTESYAEWAGNIEVEVTKNDFTMGFRQALALGIDYRDYEKVDCLEAGSKLTAVGGVWGDRQNLRCLFVDDQGQRMMRVVYAHEKYKIPELGIDGRLLSIKTAIRSRES